jgi:hypothetical protein
MPYIKAEDREALDKYPLSVQNAGELNYVITKIALAYWTGVNGKQNYQKINDIVGALEGAKMEFYRRVVAPYEDGKIKENGDVY